MASSVASMVGVEELVDAHVTDGPHLVRATRRLGVVAGVAGQLVAGGEGDEQVAAGVATRAAHPGDAQPGPLREPLALVGQQRRIRRDDHDDRARTGLRHLARAPLRRHPTGWAPRWPGWLRRRARHRCAASRACRSWPGPGRRPCSRRTRPAMTRDAVPMPPLNSWQIMPVPPPTAPSATGPPDAEARAWRTWSAVTWKPLMSLSTPSNVSPTTGRAQNEFEGSASSTDTATRASRTVPTLWVLVMATGPLSMPDSRTHSRPVSSPLPLSRWQPAKTGSRSDPAPRGQTTVTPVRTGPSPTTSGPSPRMIVAWPTVTPATSVMALWGPGVPRPMRIPRSRARMRRGYPAAVARCGPVPRWPVSSAA